MGLFFFYRRINLFFCFYREINALVGGSKGEKKLAILTIYCIRITKSKTFYRKNKSKESLCDEDL